MIYFPEASLGNWLGPREEAVAIDVEHLEFHLEVTDLN